MTTKELISKTKSTMKKYEDALGRELKVKFFLGGFNNTITCCKIHREIQISPKIKLFRIKPKFIWKEVYQGLTTDSLKRVAKYTEFDYDKLAIKCIKEYNEKTVNSELIKNAVKTINQI